MGTLNFDVSKRVISCIYDNITKICQDNVENTRAAAENLLSANFQDRKDAATYFLLKMYNLIGGEVPEKNKLEREIGQVENRAAVLFSLIAMTI